VRRLLVTASVVPSSPIFVTLMKENLGSSKMSVLTRATGRNIPKGTILYSHRREKLESYIAINGGNKCVECCKTISSYLVIIPVGSPLMQPGGDFLLTGSVLTVAITDVWSDERS
jgi:hypothetical protein